MAKFDDLLARVTDEGVRSALKAEYDQVTKNKKFGLVFEEHLPECTPLWGVKIRRGMTVARKNGDFNDVMMVLRIKDGVATCWRASANASEDIDLENLIPVARFGDPIYPVLTPIDEVENAPDDKLWHALIQADNYHALQLLEYLYKGKVDCIYIDPPYNSGARDWKYNNDYVDVSDAYRHSKWLSMMRKRLRIAKELLNPNDSVLIVTIDEKEYLHLGMLLEEIFHDAQIQMVSSVINPAGAGKPGTFYRTDEYLFFVQLGKSVILPEERGVTNVSVIWDTLRRSNAKNLREHTNSQFYPIYVNDESHLIDKVGSPYPKGKSIEEVEQRSGCTPVFPIRDDGTEMMWGCKAEELQHRLAQGYVRVGRHTPDKPQKYVISYLTSGIIDDIAAGKAIIEGRLKDGSVSAYYPSGRDKMPTTNWNRPSHDAQRFGSELLKDYIGNRFNYPKSIYAEFDCLRIVLANKPNALVLDFFAGSGTTLHAINLLNKVYGGHRRCIMVTNNEVGEKEEKALRQRGVSPGDEEWEGRGIARYITWPRTKCSIMGVNIEGARVEGTYGVQTESFVEDEDSAILSKSTGKQLRRVVYKKGRVEVYPALAEIERGSGFRTNCEFFRLDFVDKDSVALGKQFKELLPILWLKCGAKGKRPKVTQQTPDFLVFPENEFAVLTNEAAFRDFEKAVKANESVRNIYLVTDSSSAFKEMSLRFPKMRCIQLYRDYLDNFRINKSGR